MCPLVALVDTFQRLLQGWHRHRPGQFTDDPQTLPPCLAGQAFIVASRLTDEQQRTWTLRLRHLPKQGTPAVHRQAMIEDQQVDGTSPGQTGLCIRQVLGHTHTEDALGVAGLMQGNIVGRSRVNQHVEPMHEPLLE